MPCGGAGGTSLSLASPVISMAGRSNGACVTTVGLVGGDERKPLRGKDDNAGCRAFGSAVLLFG